MKNMRSDVYKVVEDPRYPEPYYTGPAWGYLNVFWMSFYMRITLPVRAELAPTAVR